MSELFVTSAGQISAHSRSPVMGLSSSHAGARFFCELIERESAPRQQQGRLLVAGCGHGGEAAYLHDRLGLRVDAVDIWLDRGRELPQRTDLAFLECDLHQLPFENETFDAVFYHHVIEHVENPARSLAELARVMTRDGVLFIGTPNRHRFAGSIGAYERSARQKLRENLLAWKMRLKGQFRNECGAHAGFSQAELDSMLAAHFPRRNWLTREYLRFKYPAGAVAVGVKVLTAGILLSVAAPAVYALCHKSGT